MAILSARSVGGGNFATGDRIPSTRTIDWAGTIKNADGAFSNFLIDAKSSALDAAKASQDRVRQDVLSRFGPSVKVPTVGDIVDKASDMISNVDGSNSGASYSAVQPNFHSGADVVDPGIDYLNADLAKHYGMDAQAAYGEALQNTAYQRAVADLKAAGLNPVLAAGDVSPAGAYVHGTLAGGSGSGLSGGGSGGGTGKYAMSSDAYNLAGVVGSVVGAVAGAAYSKSPWKLMGASTGSLVGKSLTQAIIQGVGSFRNLKK